MPDVFDTYGKKRGKKRKGKKPNNNGKRPRGEDLTLRDPLQGGGAPAPQPQRGNSNEAGPADLSHVVDERDIRAAAAAAAVPSGQLPYGPNDNPNYKFDVFGGNLNRVTARASFPPRDVKKVMPSDEIRTSIAGSFKNVQGSYLAEAVLDFMPAHDTITFLVKLSPTAPERAIRSMGDDWKQFFDEKLGDRTRFCRKNMTRRGRSDDPASETFISFTYAYVTDDAPIWLYSNMDAMKLIPRVLELHTANDHLYRLARPADMTDAEATILHNGNAFFKRNVIDKCGTNQERQFLTLNNLYRPVLQPDRIVFEFLQPANRYAFPYDDYLQMLGYLKKQEVNGMIDIVSEPMRITSRAYEEAFNTTGRTFTISAPTKDSDDIEMSVDKYHGRTVIVTNEEFLKEILNRKLLINPEKGPGDNLTNRLKIVFNEDRYRYEDMTDYRATPKPDTSETVIASDNAVFDNTYNDNMMRVKAFEDYGERGFEIGVYTPERSAVPTKYLDINFSTPPDPAAATVSSGGAPAPEGSSLNPITVEDGTASNPLVIGDDDDPPPAIVIPEDADPAYDCGRDLMFSVLKKAMEILYDCEDGMRDFYTKKEVKGKLDEITLAENNYFDLVKFKKYRKVIVLTSKGPRNFDIQFVLPNPSWREDHLNFASVDDFKGFFKKTVMETFSPPFDNFRVLTPKEYGPQSGRIGSVIAVGNGHLDVQINMVDESDSDIVKYRMNAVYRFRNPPGVELMKGAITNLIKFLYRYKNALLTPAVKTKYENALEDERVLYEAICSKFNMGPRIYALTTYSAEKIRLRLLKPKAFMQNNMQIDTNRIGLLEILKNHMKDTINDLRPGDIHGDIEFIETNEAHGNSVVVTIPISDALKIKLTLLTEFSGPNPNFATDYGENDAYYIDVEFVENDSPPQEAAGESAQIVASGGAPAPVAHAAAAAAAPAPAAATGGSAPTTLTKFSIDTLKHTMERTTAAPELVQFCAQKIPALYFNKDFISQDKQVNLKVEIETFEHEMNSIGDFLPAGLTVETSFEEPEYDSRTQKLKALECLLTFTEENRDEFNETYEAVYHGIDLIFATANGRQEMGPYTSTSGQTIYKAMQLSLRNTLNLANDSDYEVKTITLIRRDWPQDGNFTVGIKFELTVIR